MYSSEAHAAGATKRRLKPRLSRKTHATENKAGKRARAHIIETKINVAVKGWNFPWVTMVWIIHLKSTAKKAKPKKKPQIAARGKNLSRSKAASKGINASHARRSRFRVGKATERISPPAADKIDENIIPKIEPILNHQAIERTSGR